MRAALLLWLLCQPPLVTSQRHPVQQASTIQEHPKTAGDSGSLTVKPSTPDAEDRAGQAPEESDQEATGDRMVTLTGVLALIAAIQLVMFGVQISTTRRQLRAYVSVRTGYIKVEPRTDGWFLEWQPQVINTGQTPARITSVALRTEILPDPLPSEIDLVKRLREGPVTGRSQSTVGTGESVWPVHWINRVIPEAEMQGLKAGNAGSGFYAFCTVVYKDIFGQKRRTNFCQMAVWPRVGDTPIGRYTEPHNEAD